MAASLHISGIRKVFGKVDKAVEVLKRIDIDVAPGEFLILVGPSGCGKSTLLNIIAGLEEPSEGEITIGGLLWAGLAGGSGSFNAHYVTPTLPYPVIRMFAGSPVLQVAGTTDPNTFVRVEVANDAGTRTPCRG